MSSETHEIRLIAKDGASNVFRMAGTNAERMNQQIERSNQRTKRSWEEVGHAAQKVGAVIGATSILAISASNKAEVSQQRLKSSVEATGKSYEEYAKSIDKAQKAAIKLAFDDEDAADAISKLTQATNDAGKAISDLSLAEDIARARGISLASAADVVAAAEQGRIGALRRMGIAIDENATKEQALDALQQKFAGQADAYAQTNAATWERARIHAENALEAIGARLADHQAEILAASVAWTAFGSAITSAGAALGITGAGLVAIAPELAAVGVLLAAGYYAYTHPDERGRFTDSMLHGTGAPVDTSAHWASRQATPAERAIYGDNMGPVQYWDYGAAGSKPFGGTGHEAHGVTPYANEFGPDQQQRWATAVTKTRASEQPMASDMGQGLAQQNQALKAQYGEWYHLADGVVTAKDALEGFNLAQAEVMKVETKYSGQLSEYSGQLNALQAAYDEVNAKKESGAQLTAQETKFLDGYTAANERLTGGVYDSTLALGLQAEKYADNMSAADAFKAAGDGVTDSIYALIDALAGIPGYVKTTIEADTSNYWAAVIPLLGTTIGSSYINVYANRIGFGPTPEQHGGLTMAQHGYAGNSKSIMVGEAGPELMTISGGSSFVTPAAASKYSNKKRKMDGDGMAIHIGQLTVVANSPKQFGDAMRGYALSGARN